ncbi:MAG: 6-carboxytetrahydropterin synthase [Candidatus Marinimicrobia bacterium]|nr:6-carboxytetrahydropterin synthase [Candidatus Neomarinimicrobiota bacterium]
MHILYHKTVFSAAHRYWDNSLDAKENFIKFGKYSRIHGHNFSVIIGIQGNIDSENGMLMDFFKIEKLMEEKIITPYDTNYINEADLFFETKLPTTENLAVYFYQELKDQFPENVTLISVEVAENDDFSSRYEIGRN